MSDSELKYPRWQAEFHEAIDEFNHEKLINKIHKFETAVLVRLRELPSNNEHRAERQAIADAASTIRLLKMHELADHPD